MPRILSLICILLLAACQSQPETDGKKEPAGVSATDVDADYLASGGDGTNWPAINFNYAEQRYSPLDQINANNVGSLSLAWFADLPDPRGQVASPVIVDGKIYISTAWSKVFAYDAKTGKELWSYDPDVPKSKGVNACCDVTNRGIAVWRGKLFVGTIDGRLIAIDANSGARLWETQTTPKDKPYVITGAPRVVKNLVIIGNGGADFGVRGYVSAYDVANGVLKWRFYTTPNPNDEPDGAASDPVWEKAGKTWSEQGDWRDTGGGGTVWDSIVYDPELDQLYIGVGNGSPWNHGLRSNGEGDNLFLSSIVALDPDSGAYRWHYQQVPGESWDFTASQQMILADLEWPVEPAKGEAGKDGKEDEAEGAEASVEKTLRKVILHAPKNGFFFVIDRTDGKLLAAEPFVENINWAKGYDLETGRPVFNDEARYYRTKKPFLGMPGGLGAHNWQAMSYNPRTGLAYIPAQITAQLYVPPVDPIDIQAQLIGMNAGIGTQELGEPASADQFKAAIGSARGQLVAFDPKTGKPAWAVDYPAAWNGGTMTTAGNLVLQGTSLGRFRAYSAENGKQLLDLDVQSPVTGAPVTYMVDGEQYVAFLTSKGGGMPLSASFVLGGVRNLPNLPRLVVLKLDGKGKFPSPPKAILPNWEPPEKQGGEIEIATGKRLYTRFCAACHGVSAIGAGILPDLRVSDRLRDTKSWQSVVLDGKLADLGMPGFGKILNKDDVEAIRFYVIDRSHWTKENLAREVPPIGQNGAP